MLSLYKISKTSFILLVYFLAAFLFASVTFTNLKADTKLYNEAQYHVEKMMEDIQFLLEVGKTCFQECSQLTLILNLSIEVDVHLLKKFYPLFKLVKKLY